MYFTLYVYYMYNALLYIYITICIYIYILTNRAAALPVSAPNKKDRISGAALYTYIYI